MKVDQMSNKHQYKIARCPPQKNYIFPETQNGQALLSRQRRF